jgi:cobalt-zinc-cadmium efflux system protein
MGSWRRHNYQWCVCLPFLPSKHELNSRAAYLHLLADALVSFGVVIAGIIIAYTHFFWIDPAVGLLIMVVILISTWGLLKE